MNRLLGTVKCTVVLTIIGVFLLTPSGLVAAESMGKSQSIFQEVAGEGGFLVAAAKNPSPPENKELCAKMIRAGREHCERGRFKEAREFFRRAIQADPYSARAWHYYDICFVNAWAVELKNRPAPPLEATTSEPVKGGATDRTPAPASSAGDEGC